MIIIRIRRNWVRMVIMIVLAGSLGFNFYNYLQNTYLINKYESLVCITSQFDRTNLISFIAAKDIWVQGYKNVEIFDVNKGKVIKTVPSNSLIYKEAENYLNVITGLFVKVKAIPEKGYIIRIPLIPSVKVQSELLNGYNINSVDEVFIIFPEQGMPYLLVLDNKKRPYFYNFNENTDKLLEYLNFEPKTMA